MQLLVVLDCVDAAYSHPILIVKANASQAAVELLPRAPEQVASMTEKPDPDLGPNVRPLIRRRRVSFSTMVARSFDMPTSVAEIESQALSLSPEERATLADHLLASLAADPTVEEDWAVEAQRRLAELESGSVLAKPVESAIERARNAIR
jgi:putative addiction module component (TIGR02574 family)